MFGTPPVNGWVTETIAWVSPATATGATGTPGGVRIVEPFVTFNEEKVATSFPARSWSALASFEPLGSV